MLKVCKVYVSHYGENAYIVYCDNKKEGIVVDPGGNSGDILAIAEELGIKLVATVLTHAHYDHYAGISSFDLPIMICAAEKDVFEDGVQNLSSLFTGRSFLGKADVLLNDGESITVGDESLLVMHTPGHTKGSMCLYSDGVVLTGDTLFAGTYGRTDFPTGDAGALARSLSMLFKLPDDTAVFSGHNEETTIGNEKMTNMMALRLMESYLW